MATAGAAGWLAYIDADIKVSLPQPVMPAHNAYSELLLAARSMPSADRPKVIGEGGAANNHDRVAAALDGSPNKWRREGTAIAGLRRSPTSDQSNEPPFTLEESKALLEQYAPTRAQIRRALTLPYLAPPLRSMHSSTSYLSDYRVFARLLALEARVKAEEGDEAGAVNSGLDAVELGATIQRGSPLTGKLTGIACEATGRAQVWPHVDHLSGSEARAAAKRMEHIMSLHVPYADTLEIEKYGTLATMRELFESRDWRLKVSEWNGGASNPFLGLVSYVRLLPHTKRALIDRYTRLSDRSIWLARQPYYQIAARPGTNGAITLEDELIQNEAASDPLIELLLPAFYQARFKDESSSRAQNALLTAKLALRAYQCENGRSPQALSQLAPKYLSAAPQDPFGRVGQALGYRTTSAGPLAPAPVIYSVGPDLKDDGGMPAKDRRHKRTAEAIRNLSAKERADALMVEADSTGDIVAGVNVK
jgi:hypothetical protein